MNNTPETDHLEETDQHRVDVLAEHAACRRCLEHARQLERERDEAREERDDCQLELEIVIERLKGQRHPDDNGMKYEGEIDVKSIISQRDRLAEACRLLMAIVGPLEKNTWATDNQIDRAYNAGKQALATNFPQTPAE